MGLGDSALLYKEIDITIDRSQHKEQAMSGAYFYIEYSDGRCTQIEFKTQVRAKKAYDLYCKEPEDSAKCYGWEVKCDPPTLSQQIRTKKATQ